MLIRPGTLAVFPDYQLYLEVTLGYLLSLEEDHLVGIFFD